mgnify:CR=1 FL=1
MRFIVLKGRILTPGATSTLKYLIFDVIDLDPTKNLENQKRRYAWRKWYDVDSKRIKHIKENTGARQRYLTTFNKTLIDTITIFDDYLDGSFYGFVPVESFYKFSEQGTKIVTTR